jgi:hypothetical protein
MDYTTSILQFYYVVRHKTVLVPSSSTIACLITCPTNKMEAVAETGVARLGGPPQNQ